MAKIRTEDGDASACFAEDEDEGGSEDADFNLDFTGEAGGVKA